MPPRKRFGAAFSLLRKLLQLLELKNLAKSTRVDLKTMGVWATISSGGTREEYGQDAIYRCRTNRDRRIGGGNSSQRGSSIMHRPGSASIFSRMDRRSSVAVDSYPGWISSSEGGPGREIHSIRRIAGGLT